MQRLKGGDLKLGFWFLNQPQPPCGLFACAPSSLQSPLSSGTEHRHKQWNACSGLLWLLGAPCSPDNGSDAETEEEREREKERLWNEVSGGKERERERETK